MMRNIRLALKINAAFSTFTGTMLILFSNFFASFFSVSDAWPFWGLGIGLMLFAVSVFFESRRKIIKPKQVAAISIADIIWVLGTAVVIWADPFSISANGKLLLGIVAVLVGFFAFHQLYALSFFEEKSELLLKTEG